ncbi:MAG: calcium/sodium antiporter [Pleurocapsa sp. SU_5_0]|nr:calcium/sodium antiporter [Pleurocapsa sp. SU_5_0]NJR45489.1 calcium/sodium antiporter [Hyellaceae cyanobacterium CSU_1_1]
MSPITFLILVAGLVLLVVGAEFLVKGSSRLAAMLRIPPLIIGLTVVAYGTSAPEMTVSVISALSPQGANIAIGNVVGSNICNVLLILGLSSLIAPLAVSKQMIRSDVPIMIGVSLLLLMFSLDGQLGKVDSIILFIGAITYTLSLIYQSSKQGVEEDEFAQEYSLSEPVTPIAWVKNTAYIIGGLVLLVLGSRWLVDSAITIAQYFQVSELIVGLTIVAVGTSLPELFTSVIASYRGETDIAVGNVLGSNIFNILAVLGISGIIAPNGINVSQSVINFDLPVMIAVAFSCLPIFYSGKRIERWEGILFLFYYVAYTAYLILNSANPPHPILPLYVKIMMLGVIPGTIIAIITIAIMEKGQKVRNMSSLDSSIAYERRILKFKSS